MHNDEIAYVQSESLCHKDFVMVLDLTSFSIVINLVMK